MLKSTYHSLFSKLSLPLLLVIVLSTAIPVLGAQPHRATLKVSAIDPLQTTEQINVAPIAFPITEPSGSNTFQFTLTSDPGVDVVEIPFSATGSCTVSSSPVTLNSGNYDTGVSVTVTAINDDIDDGPETCTIVTGPSSSGNLAYDGLDPEDVTVTVNDDDNAGFVISETSLNIGEPNTSDTFSISLASEPTASVTVNFTPANGECNVSPSSANFSNNWNSPAVVTVTAVDDDVVDGVQDCDITIDASSGDSLYNNLTPGSVDISVADDDEAGIAVSTAGFTISEPNGSQSFNISLESEPSDAVTIGVMTSNSECIASPSPVVLDAENWSAGQSVNVTAANDSVVDGTRSCTVQTQTATSGDGNYSGQNPPDVNVMVEDDDTANFHFQVASYNVNEGDGTVNVTVVLSTPSLAPVSVEYATSSGTAVAGEDYTATSGTLNFGSNVTSQSFNVTLLDDALDENPESFTVNLSNPSGAGIEEPDTASINITDNDAPPTVQFGSVTGYAQHEGMSTATISVELSAPSGNTVTVDYATGNGAGTATTGSDYTAVSGTLTFAPGETSKSFGVPIINDALDEPNESVNLALSNPTGGAVLGTPDTSVLTIIDNDDPPQVRFSSSSYPVNEADGTRQVTIQLGAASELEVSVTFVTSNGSATAGSDYTDSSTTIFFAAGETSQTVSVPILNDQMHEPTETIILGLTTPSNATIGSPGNSTIFVQDNDGLPFVMFEELSYSVNEGDGSATVAVVLSQPSGFTVSVNYATVSGGTAAAGSDYTERDNTLVFNPGQIRRTFTVPINDDTLDEPNESINLALSGPGNATLGTPSSVVLTILDNDGQTTVQFETTTYTANESDGAAVINVVLSTPSGFEVRVDYATSNGTAGAGVDYTAVSGELVFAPGEILKTFQVPITADMINEPDETVNLTLTNPVGAALGTPNDTAVLTIVDSNEPTTVQLSQATYTVSESMLTASISVTLNVATTSSVSVAYETQAGTATPGVDFGMSTGVLVFSPGQTTQSFTVDIFPDQLDEPDETILLAISNAVNATLGEPATGTLTIVDDDPTPTVSISLSSLTVDENDGFANVIVRLSAASGRTVTVDYTTIAETAVAGSDFSATAGTLTFSPGETSKTIAVPILDDGIDEPNETFVVNISTPVFAILATPTEARITIVDADLPIFRRFFPAIFANSAIGEPNDDCIFAYGIKPNQTYEFLPDDEVDWYAVDIIGSGELVFELTNFVPLNGQLAVFKGETCEEREYLRNNGTLGLTKTVVVENMTSGRYLLYVANDGPLNNEETYRLRVYFR